jgi:CubicO group peptidase (beta-lactamase class C family)
MRITLIFTGLALVSSAPSLAQQPAFAPRSTNLLFWTQDERDTGFRMLERIAPGKVIAAGGTVHPLPEGKPLKIGIAAYMARQRNAGLLIVQGGRIRLERYALGYDKQGRWTSFSVAKSFTSSLVGAALQDGAIKSLDDKVSTYIPDMKGSAYDDVTVRQLLTMTSGVRWTEDYADPKSDVARFSDHKPEPGVDVTVSYLRRLPRAAAPGTRWHYNTGETNLIGVLVSSATKKPLSQYLSEKIWKPYGMEQDGFWITGTTGHEIAGCCLSASLRDYARYGQFMLDGGRAGGKKVLPDNWIAQATTKREGIEKPGRGYGYQWWTNDDGSFAAQGIFGQGIFIDPKRRLIIATSGNWRVAKDDATVGEEREAFYKSVQAAIDAGR